jgi:hypothetical protein
MAYGISALAETIESPDEREGSLFEPETILPEQFLAETRSRATGERLLLTALLQDAITCFQMYLFATRPRNRRLFREAERWILETDPPRQDESTQPYFTFEQTCCFLGLDPDYVRGRLLRWQRQQLAAAAQATPPAENGRSQYPPSSDHDSSVRPALVTCDRMSAGQQTAPAAVRARRPRSKWPTSKAA